MSLRGDLGFGAAADHVQFALEMRPASCRLGAAQEHLFDIRLRGASLAADGVAIDGRVAPAQELSGLPRGRFVSTIPSHISRCCCSTGRNIMPTP